MSPVCQRHVSIWPCLHCIHAGVIVYGPIYFLKHYGHYPHDDLSTPQRNVPKQIANRANHFATAWQPSITCDVIDTVQRHSTRAGLARRPCAETVGCTVPTDSAGWPGSGTRTEIPPTARRPPESSARSQRPTMCCRKASELGQLGLDRSIWGAFRDRQSVFGISLTIITGVFWSFVEEMKGQIARNHRRSNVFLFVF